LPEANYQCRRSTAVSLAAQTLSARRTATLTVAFVVALSTLSATGPSPAGTRQNDSRPVQLHWDYVSADSSGAAGSMYNVTHEVGAPTYWWSGYTGAGVDVALIDSGVAPVPGLDRAGKIVYGPDVSFESGVDGLHNLDTFGHGTHMAGIIAGRGDGFRGVAPGARIVSLKAADALGRTSVGQVIAAIKWVVEHRTANGLNIRVLNLSFGASQVQSYQVDDLAYAVDDNLDLLHVGQRGPRHHASALQVRHALHDSGRNGPERPTEPEDARFHA
jgi:subtilisin family serine protease